MGAIPKQGADIRITYITTKGRSGNSVPQNTVKNARNPLTANFTNIPIVGSHAGSSSGGDNPEDSRSIQANAPKVFSTADRAVAPPDWDALLNKYSDPIAGSVAKGRAQIIRGVKNELTIQSLLASIIAAANPSGALSNITAADIDIRNYATQQKTHTASIDTETQAIATEKTTAEAALVTALASAATATSAIAALKKDAGSLPFQELMGLTDGILAAFSFTASNVPLVKGSVAVLLDPATSALTTQCDVDSIAGRCTIAGGFLASIVTGGC